MAQYKHIYDFVVGDTYKLIKTVDYTDVAEAWWVVKSEITDSDASAALFIHNTVSGISENSDGTTTITFTATPSLTTPLSANTSYYYDVQIKLNNDEVYTTEVGRLYTEPSITQSR